MTRALVPLLTVVFLAGCDITGSAKQTAPPAKTLSHGRFVYLANHACAVAHRKLQKYDHKELTNLLVMDRVFRAVQTAYERRLFTLQGLAPPPAEAPAYHRLLTAARAQDLVIASFINEMNRLNFPAARTLAKKLDKLGKKFNNRARNLGLTVCAKP